MGVMVTHKIMRQLIKEWTLPDEMIASWNTDNKEEVSYVEETFKQYLADGWMAYSDEPTGKKQIFTFNPDLNRIVLLPPLGGG